MKDLNWRDSSSSTQLHNWYKIVRKYSNDILVEIDLEGKHLALEVYFISADKNLIDCLRLLANEQIIDRIKASEVIEWLKRCIATSHMDMTLEEQPGINLRKFSHIRIGFLNEKATARAAVHFL